MNRGPQPLRLLIAANGTSDVARAEALAISISVRTKIEMQIIVDSVTTLLDPFHYPIKSVSDNHQDFYDVPGRSGLTRGRHAFELCQWADMLVVVPMDHDSMAKMLQGIADSLLLEVVRGWDASKKMIVVPGMTTLMWENPMTKKQLVKLGKRMSWVRVMSPILWHFEERRYGKCIHEWTGHEELIHSIKYQADLYKIGHDVEIPTSIIQRSTSKTDMVLPPELWTLIMEYVGDWETAQALGIYTTLPQPADWDNSALDALSPVHKYMKELAWTILTCRVPDIREKLAAIPKNAAWLTSLCVKLIIKFSLTEVLSYMELNMKDVLWASFGTKLLPTKASAAFNRTEILEWWRTSPTFLAKDYTAEALDGASKSGFVDVLEWWRKSGLPLKYTDTALEKASAKGHIHVLEWWKEASQYSEAGLDVDVSYQSDNDSNMHVSPKLHHHPGIHLRVGRSICAAAQNGQAAVIQWFENSGIPYLHSESVAKLASAHGHVNVLEVWKSLKGEKMVFDFQVLVSPTKNGHVNVLEWWKQSGLKVEYKTYEIEEALEDSVGSEAEKQDVKRWWAVNGLNLGIKTSEWMKLKTL